MAKKAAASFACSSCGAPSLRWAGRCTRCGEFGTVTEQVAVAASAAGVTAPSRPAQPVREVAAEKVKRTATGITEFDRVIGGGLVAGQVLLVSGEPGAGKSTLLLAVADSLARRTGKVTLYISGEESVEQVAQSLTRVAKATGVTVCLVGQVTKESVVAGPRALEHIADATLTLDGDRHTSLRILRAVKNRFGPADEVACFEQSESGMMQVPDPSVVFRDQRDTPVDMLDEFDALNFSLSQRHRGIRYFVTPQAYETNVDENEMPTDVGRSPGLSVSR